MIESYPAYYERFHCIAGACEDTCCAGWEIDIDEKTWEFYKQVKGPFGERLRALIREYSPDDEDVYESHGFVLRADGRCPFLDDEGLCEIYRELGEAALCDVCTYTPRNFLEYGGRREIAISAACPEAGRLIYAENQRTTFVERESGEELEIEESEEEIRFADHIRAARDRTIEILQNRELEIEERLCRFLFYAERVQECLNENAPERIRDIRDSDINDVDIYKLNLNIQKTDGSENDSRPERADETRAAEKEEEPCETERNETRVAGKEDEPRAAEQYEYFLARLRIFSEMDSVNEAWERLLDRMRERYVDSPRGILLYEEDGRKYREAMSRQGRRYELEHLAVYYVFLCVARCVDDYDFLGKAKFVVMCYLMNRDMDILRCGEQGGKISKKDRLTHAALFAREVEHSQDNMDILAEECLFDEACETGALCYSIKCEVLRTSHR